MRQILPLSFVLALFLFSCQKTETDLPDPDPEPTTRKLLPQVIRNAEGTGYDSLVYDDKNRMIAYWSFDDWSVTRKMYSYAENGNPLKCQRYEKYGDEPEVLYENKEYTYNADGTVTEVSFTSSPKYTYRSIFFFNEKKQLIKEVREDDGRVMQELTWDEKGRPATTGFADVVWSTTTYESYDENKGLLSAVVTPFLFDISMVNRIHTVNNPLRSVWRYVDKNGEPHSEVNTFAYTYNEDGYPETIDLLSYGTRSKVIITYIEAK